MRSIIPRASCVLVLTLACLACGKKGDDATAPLAYVPADTPYVFANREPAPDAMIQRWSVQLHEGLPAFIDTFDHSLAQLDAGLAGKTDGTPQTATAFRVLHAVLDEVRGRDTLDKLREIGFDPKGLSAIYAVGVLPVLRVTLGDADAFRAALARIEQKSGSALGTAKIGEQEIRTLDLQGVQGVLAIEGRQLVITALPANADEALKRRVLGIDKPERNLADDGALATLEKERGYLPHGSGWLDLRRLVALLPKDPGVAAFAAAAGAPAPAWDATCSSEFDAIAAKFPRAVFGYTHMDGNSIDAHGRIELAPALAQALVKIGGSPPGKHADDDVLLDFGFALPVLKVRDFWVEQADAVTKAPFQCTMLAPLNEQFAQAKAKIDTTLPPPLSDLTGARVTAREFAWADGAATPQFAGDIVVGTSNPMFLVNLAQMSAPALQGIKLAADGKPVEIPASALPGMTANVVLHAAAGTNALGIAVGAGQEAHLGAAVTAAAGPPNTLLDARYGGRFYLAMGDLMGHMADKMPPEQRAQIEAQRKMYALYAKWFKYFDLNVTVGADGIDLREHVEMNAP